MRTLLAALLLAAAGCTSARAARPAGAVIAKDPVCLYHRDLGCVDVEVGPTTPRAVYGGKTYYFCADRCRARFLADPDKFARYAEQNGG
jgi:Cu+-exporting ATPase